MNFFKSVFSDDPDPQKGPDLPSDSNPNPAPTSESSINGGAWSFGDLLKTVASKSESVIQTYRRDLEEFGTGLKSETALIRDAATRVVKDLPSSIEAAQGSIESVGRAIDGLGSSMWKAIDDVEDDSERDPMSSSTNRAITMSRFEMQVRAIQSDLDTFVKDPDDLGEFERWKLGFVIGDRGEEIERLVGENGVLGEVYGKVVPELVDDEGFWGRYFYRIDKLKQVEEARADLVRRAVSGEDEENWSWDVEDDDDDDGAQSVEIDVAKSDPNNGSSETENANLEKKIDLLEVKDEGQSVEVAIEVQRNDVGGGGGEGNVGESKCDNGNEKEGLGGEIVEFSGENKPSVAADVEEIGWDEIEDLGDDNEKRVGSGGSSNKGDLQKRLSTADEEEDLSWDIEDDDGVVVDEHVKH